MRTRTIERYPRRSRYNVEAVQFVVALGAVFALTASAAAALHTVMPSDLWLKGSLVEFLMPRR